MTDERRAQLHFESDVRHWLLRELGWQDDDEEIQF